MSAVTRRATVRVSGGDGVVAANDQRAADAGAAMLAVGGNAIDAIVATAFATGVTEPWLSGIGGGAWIVGRLAASGERFSIEGPLTAPAAAREDMFEPDPASEAVGMYAWPRVVDDANMVGARSISVPGAVAALCEAQGRYGALARATVMEPAIRLAADGHEVDWLASALIAASAADLRRFPSTAALLLPDGLPLAPAVMNPGGRLVQPALARTLERIAADGPAAFYEGPIGRRIAAAVQAEGGILTAEDMAACTADHRAPAHARVGDANLFGPLHCGFPTVVEMLQLVRVLRERAPAGEVVTWARAMARAFEDRFRLMSADPGAATPWDDLMSAEAAARSVLQTPAAGAQAPAPGGCTSHMSAVDRHGNVVTLTQTVLALFGSQYVEPETGVLLNDGMMYFDPRPGRVNSVRAGVAGLAAVSPTLVERNGEPIAALGASGGRRIITAVARIVDRLLDGMPIEEAIAAPRLHVESGRAWIDPAFGDDDAAELTDAGLEVVVAAETPTTFHYARPNGVAREADGRWTASAEPSKPTGLAAGARPAT